MKEYEKCIEEILNQQWKEFWVTIMPEFHLGDNPKKQIAKGIEVKRTLRYTLSALKRAKDVEGIKNFFMSCT